MIKISKPNFWDKKKIGFIAIVLFPLTLITFTIIFFKKIFCKVLNFRIPVICVGNIYIGGTGKTPTATVLANEISKLGIKTAILCKYYEKHFDEYNQIKNYFDNLILNKDRAQGISEAEKKGYDLVILDDGLQDYKIKKDFSLVCFNGNQLIGNGLVIPSGPLRESLNALKNANAVLINGEKNLEFEKKVFTINANLEIFYSHYKAINIDEFKNHNLLAIAGIGNPENFFKLLEKNKLKINEKIIFPDHYQFNKKEIQKIINQAKEKKLKIIMTEKDFFKVKKFDLQGLNYLRVSLEIYNKNRLIDIINKLHV